MQKTSFFAMVLIGLVASLTAYGQPDLRTVEGDITHQAVVVAGGQGFGFKSPAAPMRYDDFEDGTLGANLKSQDEGGWYTFEYSGYRPTYSQGRQRIPGEMCAIQDYSESANQTIGIKNADVDTLYFTGWTYRDDFDGTAMYSENVKFWGNFTQMLPGDIPANPQCRYDAYWATNSGHLYVNVENYGDPAARGVYAGPRAYLDEWFRLEGYMAIGDPGQPNGVTWRAYNGEKFAEIEGIFHNSEQTYNYWIIGQYFRKNPDTDRSLPVASVKTYWGELYVDNTLARVELGNAPAFDDCTHREIQIPVTWSDNQVSFTVNSGSFDDGEELYLFVVDADGSASAGYPVTMGGTAVSDLPGVPVTPSLR